MNCEGLCQSETIMVSTRIMINGRNRIVLSLCLIRMVRLLLEYRLMVMISFVLIQKSNLSTQRTGSGFNALSNFNGISIEFSCSSAVEIVTHLKTTKHQECLWGSYSDSNEACSTHKHRHSDSNLYQFYDVVSVCLLHMCEMKNAKIGIVSPS